MRCQEGHCDWTAKVWLTKGGRAKKVCTTHSKQLIQKGWAER